MTPKFRTYGNPVLREANEAVASDPLFQRRGVGASF